VIRLGTDLPELASAVGFLYADFAVDSREFADYHVRVSGGRGLRRRWRPQARFLLDGRPAFAPAPRGWALPLLEWGLNWCVSRHAHQFVVLHAAAVERDGRALLLPGRPGSGKSTLCAALAHRGWRLLSDELALLRPGDGEIQPLARPVTLKGGSIEVVRALAPDAPIGPLTLDTRKGTVAHVRPAADSVRRAGERARPAWVVFPAYRPGAAAALRPLSPARALMRLGASCFNHSTLGTDGFETLAAVAERCGAHELEHGDLDDALAAIDGIVAG
jgi:HprK-related kinase A